MGEPLTVIDPHLAATAAHFNLCAPNLEAPTDGAVKAPAVQVYRPSVLCICTVFLDASAPSFLYFSVQMNRLYKRA